MNGSAGLSLERWNGSCNILKKREKKTSCRCTIIIYEVFIKNLIYEISKTCASLNFSDRK